VKSIKISALILCLCIIFVLSGCNKADNIDTSSPNYSNVESYNLTESITASETEESLYKSELKDEFVKLYEKELVIIDFILSRTEINSKEAEFYCDDSPFKLYKLNSEHKFSTKQKLLDACNQIYSDGQAAFNMLLEYPKYGPKVITFIEETTYISDNYMLSNIFSIDIDSIKILSLDQNSAEIRFTGLEISITASIRMKKINDMWLLDNSIYFALEKAEEDQLLATNWEDNLTDGAQNSGTATRLYGDILVINIFISDGNSEWNKTAISDMLEYVDKATNYLEKMALAYNVESEITATSEAESLYFVYNGTIPDDYTYTIWIEEMMAYTTYGSLKGYVEAYFTEDELSKYDNYCVLLNVNKSGRSYAIQCNTDNYDSELNYLERAVMFYSTDRNYNYFMCPSTYAHEILHLFGASDLYFPQDSDDERAKIAENYVWSDIMRYIPADDIESATISNFTAFKVGLFPYLDSQLFLFNNYEK